MLDHVKQDRDRLLECLRMANSYSRLPVLLDLSAYLEPIDWLALLGREWSCCDNIGEHVHDLLETPGMDLLDTDIPRYRNHLMTAQEQSALASLPQTVTIWRGCYDNNRSGICWSLSEQVARSFPFAHRYKQKGQAYLLRAQVARTDVMMLKLDRGEFEVVTNCAVEIDCLPISESLTGTAQSLP